MRDSKTLRNFKALTSNASKNRTPIEARHGKRGGSGHRANGERPHIAAVGSNSPTLASDLIWGAKDIAGEIHGCTCEACRKKIYNLYANGRSPIVKIGGIYVVRRSTLQKWLATLEERSLNGLDTPSTRA
jgi:hypothetical protein